MKTDIYYFSGTGNSFVAAYTIKKAFPEAQIHPIDMNTKEIISERLIFVVPSYGYGMPCVVYNLFKHGKIKGEYIAFLSTCGSIAGGIMYQAKKFLKKQGQILNYSNHIDTVENYFVIFKQGTKEEELLEVEEEYRQINLRINDIQNSVNNSPKKYFWGRFVSFWFRHFRRVANIGIKVESDCKKCGICINHCPVHAISNGKNKVVINKGICQHCQGCINICPSKSISLGRVNKKHGRYIHPDYHKHYQEEINSKNEQ